MAKCGFHAMRRFREVWLRKSRMPENLIRFRLGHADRSVTDGYSQLSEDVEHRSMLAEQKGVGFELPDAWEPMIAGRGEEKAGVGEPEAVVVSAS